MKFAPDDVAFYSTSLRLREQFDLFVNSKAFAKLKEIPTIMMGLSMAEGMWSTPPNEQGQMAKALLDQPENKELTAMLADAVSDEIFVYGSGDYSALIELGNSLSQVQRTAQITALRTGRDPEEEAIRQVVEAVNKSLDNTTIPDTVIGMKITDAERAKRQVQRLMNLVPMLEAQVPQMEGRIKTEQIGVGEFVTIRLDGTLIPWEEILEDADAVRSEVETLAEKVKPKTLVIALGVWKDYLLISAGDTTDHLASLGDGKLLIDRDEMAPCAKYGDKRLTEINYVSASLMKQISSADRQVDQMVTLAEQAIPLAGLDSQLEQELIGDLKKFGGEMKAHLPEPGAVTSLTFLNGRGYEGYSYNYGENHSLDASQPLGILKHLGGTPILAIARRSVYVPECYDGMASWFDRVVYYAEKIGVPQMDPSQRELYEKLRVDLEPLVKQLGTITRDKLVPAMKDGQFAFVLDDGTTMEQVHQAMPPADPPVPFLEIGVAYGVSDAEMLKEAARDYFDVLQQIIDAVHEAAPNQVPEIQIPAPEAKEFPSGTVYYYRLPKQFGLDKHLAPCVAIGDDTMAFSLLPRQASRMLESTDLQAGSPLADPNREMGTAAYFNFVGLIEAAEPWVEYGMKLGFADSDPNWVDHILSEVNAGLEVAKCFKGVSTATYQEGDVWVTHVEATFEDLP